MANAPARPAGPAFTPNVKRRFLPGPSLSGMTADNTDFDSLQTPYSTKLYNLNNLAVSMASLNQLMFYTPLRDSDRARGVESTPVRLETLAGINAYLQENQPFDPNDPVDAAGHRPVAAVLAQMGVSVAGTEMTVTQPMTGATPGGTTLVAVHGLVDMRLPLRSVEAGQRLYLEAHPVTRTSLEKVKYVVGARTPVAASQDPGKHPYPIQFELVAEPVFSDRPQTPAEVAAAWTARMRKLEVNGRIVLPYKVYLGWAATTKTRTLHYENGSSLTNSATETTAAGVLATVMFQPKQI